MAKKGPGRCHRTGMTVVELLAMFPDDATAERWFEDQRWPGGVRHCPDCGSLNTVAVKSVRGEASTNGMEAFFSLFKRSFHGTFHKLSPKHMDRYVAEFAGRNNIRDLDTLDQMASMARRFDGRRLTYADLIADNGRSSGARPTA